MKVRAKKILFNMTISQALIRKVLVAFNLNLEIVMARKESLLLIVAILFVTTHCLLGVVEVDSIHQQLDGSKISENDIHNDDIIDLDQALHNEDQFESKHPDYKTKFLSGNVTTGTENITHYDIQYCSTQSIVRARQYINFQLETINNLINVWLNDVDSQEIMDQQKKSLANLMLATGDPTNRLNMNSNQIFNPEGQPYIEIESSYFKPFEAFSDDKEMFNMMRIPSNEMPPPISIKLVRRYKDKCYLDPAKGDHIYQFAVSVGPFVHSLDFIQHLPRELRLTQPIDWRYCQARMIVQRMIFEVSLRQRSNESLAHGCPVELLDITHLKHLKQRPYKMMLIKGFSSRNETDLANQLRKSRFFFDYTLPSLTNRLRHMLRFQFEGESLPL